jgi:hypothetical protein
LEKLKRGYTFKTNNPYLAYGDQVPHQLKDLSNLTLTILLKYQKSTFLTGVFILSDMTFNIDVIDMLFSL